MAAPLPILKFYLVQVRTCGKPPNEDWEIIADNLSKAGWSWGCVSTINSNWQTIFVVDAHRDDGRRFVDRSDEKLSAFVELERVTRESLRFPNDDQFGKILPTS